MNIIDSPMHCEGCRNATFNQDRQTGCKFELIEKLNGYNENDGLYYSLKKVCLFKNKTKEEVDIKLGYVFILKDISKKQVLYSNIERIKSKNPLWVGVSVVSEDINAFSKIRDEIALSIGECCKYNIILNSEDYSDYYKLDQFMDHYKNGWTYVNEVGDYFRADAKEKLEKYVLIDSKKAGMVSSEPEQINDICFYNFIYKCLNGNKPEFNDSDQKFYFKNFYDKVHEKDAKMIVEWRDL